MRIAVTGGLGLLGSAVVGRLVDRGHTPVIVDRAVRSSKATSSTSDDEVEQRRADVRDRESLIEALSGADGVIHTASLIDLHLGRPRALHEVNVDGARNVVEACRHNGIPRLVHMSSAEVITGHQPLRGVTESEASYPDPQLTYYGLTKQGGEETVLGAADIDLGTCAMRTYGLFGVGDNTMVPLYLSTLPGKSIVAMGDLSSRSDVVFAPNLAYALVLAVEQLTPDVEWSGSPFHVTDHEPVNIQQFLIEMVAPLGYRVVERVRLPAAAARALAATYEARYKLTGWERFARPPLTRHKLILGLGDYWLDRTRLDEVLDYEPPFTRAEAVEATQEWLVGRHR